MQDLISIGMKFKDTYLTALGWAVDLHDLYDTEEASASDIINTSPLAAYIIIMGTTHTKVIVVKEPEEKEHIRRLAERGLDSSQISDRLYSQFSTKKKYKPFKLALIEIVMVK